MLPRTIELFDIEKGFSFGIFFLLLFIDNMQSNKTESPCCVYVLTASFCVLRGLFIHLAQKAFLSQFLYFRPF